VGEKKRRKEERGISVRLTRILVVHCLSLQGSDRKRPREKSGIDRVQGGGSQEGDDACEVPPGPKENYWKRAFCGVDELGLDSRRMQRGKKLKTRWKRGQIIGEKETEKKKTGEGEKREILPEIKKTRRIQESGTGFFRYRD